MKIIIQKGIEKSEEDYLERWGEQVFPIEGRNYTWSPASHHVIARDGTTPVGHIGFGEFNIQTGGNSLTVIGVGGVVVRPEYQGKNIPAKMFKALHEAIALSAHTRLFTLFCPKRLVTYYNKHGYTLYEGKVMFMQNKQLVPSAQFCFMHYGSNVLGSFVHLTTEPW